MSTKKEINDWFEMDVGFNVKKKKVRLKIYHNIPDDGSNINTPHAALDAWLARTSEFTDESFVNYINSKGIYRAFTKEQWDSIANSED